MNRASGIAVVGAMLWTAALITQPAFAHATFEGATPEPGARLAAGPQEIVLRFSEPVTPISVRLLDVHLQDVGQTRTPEIDRSNLRLHVASPLIGGRYLVTYRVISEDAHPVSGSFEFMVGAASFGGAASILSPAAASPWARVQGPVRILSLIASVLTAGLALFIAIFGRMAAKATATATATAALRLGVITTVLAAILEFADFAISGATMVGGGWAAVVRGTTWRLAAESSLGRSALLAYFGVLCVGTGLSKRGIGAAPRTMLVAGALALAGSRAVTGHAAATSGALMLAMLAHVLFAAFWAGALAPLWISLRDGSASATRRLIEAFSRWAVVAVSMLVLLGSIMAWTHIRTIEALTHSEYGRLLIIKLLAVAVLLLLAASNKYWLTPTLAGDDGTSARRMQIIVGVEILGMALVLAMSAMLSRTAPARVARAEVDRTSAAASLLQGTINEGNYHVVWRLWPAKVNADDRRLTLSIERERGIPVNALSITASFALPAKGLEPLAVSAQRVGPGQYSAIVHGVTEPGRWRLGLEILISDFDKLVLDTAVILP